MDFKRAIAHMQNMGFDVYKRPEASTYFLITNGKDICYAQLDNLGWSLTTVHKPNKTTGTGFRVHSGLNKFNSTRVEECFITAPNWASSNDHASVKKWASIHEFLNANQFNKSYELVDPIIED